MIRAASLSQRLANILAARGKTADFIRDCVCMDDSDGQPPWLAYWDAVKLGAEPTQADVDAASETPTAECKDLQAQAHVDAKDRLLFEVNFVQENRIRAIEGKSAITRAQYRDALIAEWKRLNA